MLVTLPTLLTGIIELSVKIIGLILIIYCDYRFMIFLHKNYKNEAQWLFINDFGMILTELVIITIYLLNFYKLPNILDGIGLLIIVILGQTYETQIKFQDKIIDPFDVKTIMENSLRTENE